MYTNGANSSVKQRIDTVGSLIDGLNNLIESEECTKESPIAAYHINNNSDANILNLEVSDGKVIVNLVDPIIFDDDSDDNDDE